MKRFSNLFLLSIIVCLVAVFSFTSCEKEGGAISNSWLAGSWVLTDSNDITYYWTLTKDGKFTYYELSYGSATFSGGTLTNYNYSYSVANISMEKSSEWKASLKGTYTIDSNFITCTITDDWYLDKVVVQITKLGKDSAMIMSDAIKSGKVERVKSFKTETKETQF